MDKRAASFAHISVLADIMLRALENGVAWAKWVGVVWEEPVGVAWAKWVGVVWEEPVGVAWAKWVGVVWEEPVGVAWAKWVGVVWEEPVGVAWAKWVGVVWEEPVGVAWAKWVGVVWEEPVGVAWAKWVGVVWEKPVGVAWVGVAKGAAWAQCRGRFCTRTNLEFCDAHLQHKVAAGSAGMFLCQICQEESEVDLSTVRLLRLTDPHMTFVANKSV